MSGLGESAGAQGESGDLYVVVHVKKDTRFHREGNAIYTEAHIAYPQAVLGDTIEVETVEGMKKLVIPEGTQSHQQIRLKNLGVTDVRGGSRGHQYVKVIVDVPKRVSKGVKELLEELREELE